MTLRAEIRGVLSAGEKTVAQLIELCDSGGTDKQMHQNLYLLRKEGKVTSRKAPGEPVRYAIARWPEKGEAKAPPPRRGGKQKGKKARKASAAARATAATVHTSALPPNGAADFAITAAGVLTMLKTDARVDLDPAEFGRLRVFIDRTQDVWNPSRKLRA